MLVSARGLHIGAQTLAGEAGYLFGKRARRFEHRLASSELQSKFAADAMRDYLEDMAKITQLSAKTSQEVWTSWQGFSMRLAGGDVARPS